MSQKTQVIPCYAGLSNVHLMPRGDLWPCCVLGQEYSLGNLRDFEYDFRKVLRGSEAREVRGFIDNKGCHCPLANQAYSNILCHWPSLARVFWKIVR